jgi:hypothetical protein
MPEGSSLINLGETSKPATVLVEKISDDSLHQSVAQKAPLDLMTALAKNCEMKD